MMRRTETAGDVHLPSYDVVPERVERLDQACGAGRDRLVCRAGVKIQRAHHMADGALWLPQRLMRLIVRQLLLVDVLFVFLFLKFFQLLKFLFEVVWPRAAVVDEQLRQLSVFFHAPPPALGGRAPAPDRTSPAF